MSELIGPDRIIKDDSIPFAKELYRQVSELMQHGTESELDSLEEACVVEGYGSVALCIQADDESNTYMLTVTEHVSRALGKRVGVASKVCDFFLGSVLVLDADNGEVLNYQDCMSARDDKGCEVSTPAPSIEFVPKGKWFEDLPLSGDPLQQLTGLDAESSVGDQWEEVIGQVDTQLFGTLDGTRFAHLMRVIAAVPPLD